MIHKGHKENTLYKTEWLYTTLESSESLWYRGKVDIKCELGFFDFFAIQNNVVDRAMGYRTQETWDHSPAWPWKLWEVVR